ncbi:hypothetical protein JOB18_036341 [Solea senegalensis]|uniref:Uncharacterized protein n=1 Tax=Solea senegalensis TaxID=28829 RepID=A0AAV6S255_SOLSE|nr:hypothetical protein JOB18_036341 [Solea senegalensis]
MRARLISCQHGPEWAVWSFCRRVSHFLAPHCGLLSCSWLQLNGLFDGPPEAFHRAPCHRTTWPGRGGAGGSGAGRRGAGRATQHLAVQSLLTELSPVSEGETETTVGGLQLAREELFSDSWLVNWSLLPNPKVLGLERRDPAQRKDTVAAAAAAAAVSVHAALHRQMGSVFSSQRERCHETSEAEVSCLSGHRERFTEVLRGEVWQPGPQEDRG